MILRFFLLPIWLSMIFLETPVSSQGGLSPSCSSKDYCARDLLEFKLVVSIHSSRIGVLGGHTPGSPVSLKSEYPDFCHTPLAAG